MQVFPFNGQVHVSKTVIVSFTIGHLALSSPIGTLTEQFHFTSTGQYGFDGHVLA